MGQVISIILAAVIGFILWGLVAALSKGAYPFGAAGALESIVFFGPILGLVLPAVLRQAAGEKSTSIAWLLALAPIAGLLNFVLFFVAYAICTAFIKASDTAMNVATALSAGVWVLPLYLQVRPAKQNPPDGDSVRHVKLLRRPGRW